jgi:hypothetical protein
MLAEATGAERAEVWLRSGGAEHLEAAWPQQLPGPGAVRPPGTSDAAAGGPAADPATAADERTRDFAVEHRGERLGTLRLTC